MTCADKIRKMQNGDLHLLFSCLRFSSCTTQYLLEIVCGKFDDSTATLCEKHSSCSECVKEALETEV
jgi:hypothetical protein